MKYLFIALVLLTACSGNTGKKDNQQNQVTYETYHNYRYDYTVEYPNFLIPQGEATNQDGQKFLSEDQEIQLIVYCGYRFDFNADGDAISINKAYEEDLAFKEEIINKKLEDNHYIIEYKMNNRLHTDYVLVRDDMFFNIRFQYPEKDKNRMEGVVEYVINGFKLEVLDFNAAAQDGNASAGEFEDMFLPFIEGFLNDCYWEKNFNNLLRSNDETLATYIDSKMDVRRYHAPGTVTRLATRDEDFGFSEYDDFMFRPRPTGNLIFEYVNDDDESTPCELYYNELNDETYVIYYRSIKSVPDLVVNNETFETEPVKIAWPEAEIMAVYLPDAHNNPRGFYFINTPDGWKLAFVDDSMCGA